MGIHSVKESSTRTYDTVSDLTSPSSTTTAMEINFFGFFLVLIPPMIGGFLYGFDIGATSFVLVMLLNPPEVKSSGITVWWTNLSSTRQGLIVSGLSLGALIGSHIIFIFLSKLIGRRMELRLCAVFYVFGAFLNVMSGTILREFSILGFLTLLLGRVLYGIGVGFVMHGAPAYLVEMSPPKIRGAVVSAKETIIVGGIVAGYMVGNCMSTNALNWTYLYGVCGIMALPMFALTYYIPRSKRWLLMQGLNEEAYESMKFIYNGNITKEYKTLADSVLAGNFSLPTTTKKRKHSLLDLRYRKAVFASMGLIIFQQFSGQPRYIKAISIMQFIEIAFDVTGIFLF